MKMEQPGPPAKVASNDQLGAFFTAEMLQSATMTGEQEGRAYRGYCPKCGEHKLRLAVGGPIVAGVKMAAVFKLCAACGAGVVLGA
jgi:ribosomal protein S27AE